MAEVNSMKKFYLTFITLFFVLLICRISLAANYYVDAAKGNDLNSGTRELPVKTISKGVIISRAGDTIWIASGIYRETITLIRSGTNSEHTISIRPVPDADVIIKGSDIVKDWEHHSGSIWKRTDWSINSQQVFVDGMPFQQIGNNCKFNVLRWGKVTILPPVGTGLSDMIPGSFFYDQEKKILFIRMNDGSSPNTHFVEASVRNLIVSSHDINFIELHNLNFAHSNVSSIPYMMGMVNIEGKAWLVAGCTFTYGDFAGLNVTGEGHRIINNICNYNGNLGISINGSDATHNWQAYAGRPPQNIILDGNETSFNNYRKFYYYFQAGGIKGCNSCSGVKIIRHTAESNHGPGVWFDIDCKNITIDRCLLKNNTRGIEYEISGKGLISNNLVIGNIDQGIYVSASDNVEVINNTVHNNKYGIMVHGMPRSEHMSLKNNIIRNNIIGKSSKAHLVMYTNPITATDNTSDFNLFFSKNSSVKISWTKTKNYHVNFNNLESFSSETFQDINSIADNPLWNNIATDDYSLKKMSSAIDAGSNEVNIGEKDYSGKLRTLDGKNSGKGNIDIGAFEYAPLSNISQKSDLFHSMVQ